MDLNEKEFTKVYTDNYPKCVGHLINNHKLSEEEAIEIYHQAIEIYSTRLLWFINENNKHTYYYEVKSKVKAKINKRILGESLNSNKTPATPTNSDEHTEDDSSNFLDFFINASFKWPFVSMIEMLKKCKIDLQKMSFKSLENYNKGRDLKEWDNRSLVRFRKRIEKDYKKNGLPNISVATIQDLSTSKYIKTIEDENFSGTDEYTKYCRFEEKEIKTLFERELGDSVDKCGFFNFIKVINDIENRKLLMINNLGSQVSYSLYDRVRNIDGYLNGICKGLYFEQRNEYDNDLEGSFYQTFSIERELGEFMEEKEYEKDGEILILFYEERLSYEEICRTLKILDEDGKPKEDTARQRKKRAWEKLKKWLVNKYIDEFRKEIEVFKDGKPNDAAPEDIQKAWDTFKYLLVNKTIDEFRKDEKILSFFYGEDLSSQETCYKLTMLPSGEYDKLNGEIPDENKQSTQDNCKEELSNINIQEFAEGREILSLFCMEGLNYKEICNKLNILNKDSRPDQKTARERIQNGWVDTIHNNKQKAWDNLKGWLSSKNIQEFVEDGEILSLFYEENLNYKEICRQLNILNKDGTPNEVNARKRIQKAWVNTTNNLVQSAWTNFFKWLSSK